jgi:peptidoglycan/LPS O-acetylase OafA/YrhL
LDSSPALVETAFAHHASPPRRIERIDSLRAVAMLAVIAEHAHLLPFGWAGVWLFYVISGFVVTTSLVARAETGHRLGDALSFYARRSARILPIYYLYIAVGLVVSSLWLGRADWRPFASMLFMYNNFADPFGNGFYAHFPAGHLWTISVEWQFYLLYGCLFIWAPRAWVVALGLVLIAVDPVLRVVAGAILLRHQAPLDAAYSVYTFSPLHFDAFAMGSLLALFRDRLNGRHGLIAGAVGLVLLAAYVLVYAAIDRGQGAHGIGVLRNLVSGILIGQGREGPLYTIVDLLAASLLLIALDGRMPLPFAGSRRLQYVGRISYGGYVYHQAMLWLFAALLPPSLATGRGAAARIAYDVATFVFCATLTIAAAAISYRWLERPVMRRVGRAVDHALHREPAAVAAMAARG